MEWKRVQEDDTHTKDTDSTSLKVLGGNGKLTLLHSVNGRHQFFFFVASDVSDVTLTLRFLNCV